MAVATIFYLALTFSSARGLAIWLADRRSAAGVRERDPQRMRPVIGSAATGVYALVFAKFAGMYTARPVAVPSRPTM